MVILLKLSALSMNRGPSVRSGSRAGRPWSSVGSGRESEWVDAPWTESRSGSSSVSWAGAGSSSHPASFAGSDDEYKSQRSRF